MIRLWEDESAQALAEYGLILCLVFLVCIIAISTLGLSINDVLYGGLLESMSGN